MKKKIVIALTLFAAISVIGGCGRKEISNDTVKVIQYKDLQMEKPELQTVSDADVDEKISQNLEKSATFKEVKRKSQNGDLVNVDYTGKIDGEKFDGGSCQGADIEIGSNTYIQANEDYKGFEEQLIGHKAGEKFKIKVKFPSDYSVELSNKVAEFTIKMNSVNEKIIPQFDDDWVSANSSESKTTTDYKKEIKNELTKECKKNYETELQSKVLEVLLKNTEFVVEPTEKIEEEYNSLYSNYVSYAQANNMEMEEFVKQYMNISFDKFKENLQFQAKNSIKEKEAIQLIAAEENIELSKEEYEKSLPDMAKEYGFDNTDDFVKYYHKETIEDYLLENKVLNWIADASKPVEPSEEE